MHARALALLASSHPPAVTKHGRQVGAYVDLGRLARQWLFNILSCTRVTIARHLRADRGGQFVDLTRGDGKLSHHVQGGCRDVIGTGHRHHVQDAMKNGGTVTVAVDLQRITLREKNPDGTSGSGPPVRRG